MSSFQEGALRVLNELKAIAPLDDQKQFIKQVEQSLADRQVEVQRSKTHDKTNIFRLINLAREAGNQADFEESVWHCPLATPFLQDLLCHGESTNTPFPILSPFTD